jgi:uncharacterized membrane protein
MRRIVNEPDLKLFVFYGLLLIPTFFLCCEKGNLPFFFVVAVMLLTSIIEIPVYRTRTKKPEYSEREAMRMGEFYGVPVAEEMQKDGERMYKTRITLNLGGFIVPLFFSALLLLRACKSYHAPVLEVAIAVLLMTLFSFMLSEVKGGVGIIVPGYVGIFAIPLGLVIAPEELRNVAELLIFAPAIFGILLGILIRLATLRKEEVGSAFFNIGGIGSFPSIIHISFLALLIGTVA